MCLSLYIHIPFCHVKCGYCDFNSYAMQGAIVEEFVEALHEEIERSPYAGVHVPTVFFGGGTPTFLSGEQLTEILEHLARRFQIEPEAEITSEANPGTVDVHKLCTMREGGFNRISFGAQSFEDAELKRMDRLHTAEEIVQAVRAAREAGFTNLNLDLIFALPNQTLERWQSNLHRAMALNPEHLSLYCLTLEPNTRFYQLYRKGKLTLPDDEVQVAMYEFALSCTAERGYEQYEISNFAKPGYRCRHNVVYWRNEPYLGFGPGAVSYVEGRRWTNIKHPREYIRRIRAGESPELEWERLTGWDSVAETIMLGLRMNDGLNLQELEYRYHLPVQAHYQDIVSCLVQKGWLEREDSLIRLTPAGRLFANEVALAFFE